MSRDFPRFHVPELVVGEVILTSEESSHAASSLRLKPGDACILFDGRGHSAEAVVVEIGVPGKRSRAAPVRCRVEQVCTHTSPSARLTLVVSACKGDRLDWLIEKCTELGVSRVVLTNFARSVVRVEEKHGARLQRTALEAAKQCGRMWLPEILVSGAPPDISAETLIAHPAEGAESVASALAANKKADPTVFIGPEGGFTDSEIAQFRTVGARLVRLAANILRVETAAVAVAAVWAAGEITNGE